MHVPRTFNAIASQPTNQPSNQCVCVFSSTVNPDDNNNNNQNRERVQLTQDFQMLPSRYDCSILAVVVVVVPPFSHSIQVLCNRYLRPFGSDFIHNLHMTFYYVLIIFNETAPWCPYFYIISTAKECHCCCCYFNCITKRKSIYYKQRRFEHNIQSIPHWVEVKNLRLNMIRHEMRKQTMISN